MLRAGSGGKLGLDARLEGQSGLPFEVRGQDLGQRGLRVGDVASTWREQPSPFLSPAVSEDLRPTLIVVLMNSKFQIIFRESES